MFEVFSHYLSYGATDQQTLRDLSDSYRGLVVPGTVAAFQREGTGGFVLSLSAQESAPPYVIDPRFPLFQKALIDPKKSHIALAEILESPELLWTSMPAPADFSDDLVQRVARKWVDFNTNYTSREAGKFEKYAKLLEEEVARDAVQGPEAIIAPYLVADGRAWWERSKALMEATVAAASGNRVLRVVATTEASQLDDLLKDVSDEQVIVWVSGLKEIEVSANALVQYGSALRSASMRRQQCFAIYGGFFSVLLAAAGLRGACHGIGYGEDRSWPELPQSGPPPPRYYAPRFHRYISQDLAYQLWSRDADLTACDCPICSNGSPVLSYHDLMKHSVHARQAEIDSWGNLDLGQMASRLETERRQLEDDLQAAELPNPLRGPVARATNHLPRWVEALQGLAAG
jgi:hypothetical protein